MTADAKHADFAIPRGFDAPRRLVRSCLDAPQRMWQWWAERRHHRQQNCGGALDQTSADLINAK